MAVSGSVYGPGRSNQDQTVRLIDKSGSGDAAGSNQSKVFVDGARKCLQFRNS